MILLGVYRLTRAIESRFGFGSMLSKLLPLSIAVFALAAANICCGQHLRHVRVIWTTDPTTTATVAWTTDGPGDRSQVNLREESATNWDFTPCDRNEQFVGKFEQGRAPYLHVAHLQDLKPGTRYDVICETDDTLSNEYYFVTAPDDDRPFALLSGGDSRSGITERKNVNRMMARMVAEQTKAGRPEILALSHGGDFVVDGPQLELWLAWLTHYELTTTEAGRLLPIVPTRGNHDMGLPFNQVFAFPRDSENYYAISFGNTLRLATLNTEVSTAGDQRQWLADELAAHRWQHRWYVAQYHKPAFPAVKIPSGALPHWVPLFDEYSVDLVCEADGHVIKRTPPLKNLKVDPAGVVYIGEGGLGVGQRTPKTYRWYLQDMAQHCSSGHHVHLLTFDGQEMDVRVIRLGGEQFDHFTRTARRPPGSQHNEEVTRDSTAAE